MFEVMYLKYTDLDFHCFHFLFIKSHADSKPLYNYEVQSNIFPDFEQKVDFQKIYILYNLKFLHFWLNIFMFIKKCCCLLKFQNSITHRMSINMKHSCYYSAEFGNFFAKWLDFRCKVRRTTTQIHRPRFSLFSFSVHQITRRF